MHTLYYALIFGGLYLILALLLMLFWQLTMKLPFQKKAKSVLFTVGILVALFLISVLKPVWLHLFQLFEIVSLDAEKELVIRWGEGLSFGIERDLDKSLTAAYIFVVAYLADTLLGYFVWNGILIDPETGDPYVPKFLQQIAAGLIFAVAVLASVAIYYPALLQGTATTLGASGAIGAFVAADPIKKAITAISLNINKPIKKGEYVSMGNVEGIVDSIGWRAIRVLTDEQSLLTIPTTNFLNSNYINHSRPDNSRCIDIKVTVRTSVSPEKIRQLLKRCGEASPYSTGEATVRLTTMDSVFSEYVVTVSTKDNHINSIKNDVLSAMWYALRREKILPYPEGYIISEQDKVKSAMRQLNNVPTLASLPDEEDEMIAQNSELLWYGYPETVVLQDEVETCLYIVAKGTLDVLVKQPDGSQLKVGTLGENQIFGEMGLLTGAPRTATVRATSETLLCKISKNAIQPIIQNRPDVVEYLSDMLAERETKNIQASSEYSEEQKNLAKQSSKERLLNLMSDLFTKEDEGKA